MKRISLLIVALAVNVEAPIAASARAAACIVTPPTLDSAPPDLNVKSSGPSSANVQSWYINDDRTIWAGPVPANGWPAGGFVYQGNKRVNGQKTYWVKPWGAQLRIGGRRIDAAGPPLEANIPCCYGTGFQIVALYFPTEGCWEVTATAGDRALRFVTEVTRQGSH